MQLACVCPWHAGFWGVFLDDTPITQLLQTTGILIPLEAAADELIDLSGFLLMAENFICFMQNEVSFRLYGVVSSITSLLWGHDYLFVSGTDWHSRTHREDGIQVFSVVY